MCHSVSTAFYPSTSFHEAIEARTRREINLFYGYTLFVGRGKCSLTFFMLKMFSRNITKTLQNRE